MMKKVLVLVICCMAFVAFLAGGAWGAEFCVSTATELQDALDDAAINSEADTIQVVQGTYNGNFEYESSEGDYIYLCGGFIPGTGCASRELDPTNTILDGGTNGIVLYLYNSNGGDISVDGFTIQEGDAGSHTGGGVFAKSASSSGTAGNITLLDNIVRGNYAGWFGGGVYAESYSSSGSAGAVTLTNNTITDNFGGLGGGGLAASGSDSGTSGAVTLLNNIITENESENSAGGVGAYAGSASGTAGTVTLINNTITGNIAATYNPAGGGGVDAYAGSVSGTAGTVTLTNNTITGNHSDTGGGAYLRISSGGIVNVYNNIIWGNTATTSGGDIMLSKDTSVANGYNNDYTVMAGDGWDNEDDNINYNPLFVGGGNYHLQAGSPCIDTGLNIAPELPDYDFEGDDRIIDGNKDGTAKVDMGADEYVPVEEMIILHKDGAMWSSDTGWTLTTPPYYAGSNYARDLEYLDDDDYLILHKDGAVWSSSGGWVMTTPPYYAGTGYARALELRADMSYVILHQDGAFYDSSAGWTMTSPPYYPGSSYAVDLEVR